MNKNKRFIFILFLFLSLAPTILNAQEIILDKISIAELEKIYQFYNYTGEKGYLRIPEYTYPPIYLKSFPTDYTSVQDEKKRNALFIKILTPLAMKINEEIQKERTQIEQIATNFRQEKDLSKQESLLLEDKAKKYDIFTRLQGYQRNRYLIKELLKRVDNIPPSFLIAAAAMETNWGTSRIVKEGNALYKQLTWYTNQGLKPQGEDEDNSYRIATYPDLYTSMQNFALKLNSSVSFEHLRGYRQKIRYFNSQLSGTTFAHTLLWNSPLQNYAGILEYTIAYYELNVIDKSRLDSKIIKKPLPQELQKRKGNKKVKM